MRGRFGDSSKEGRECGRVDGMGFKDRVKSQNGGMCGQGREDSEQLEDARNKMRGD